MFKKYVGTWNCKQSFILPMSTNVHKCCQTIDVIIPERIQLKSRMYYKVRNPVMDPIVNLIIILLKRYTFQKSRKDIICVEW